MGRINWTQKQIDEIVNLYEEKRWTINALSKRFKVSITPIRKILLDHGIEIKRVGALKKWKQKDVDKILKLYKSGMPIRKLAEKYKCHHRTMLLLLKNNEIKIRMSNKAPNDVIFVDNVAKLEIISKGKKYICLIDKEDYDKVKGYRWSFDGSGYAVRFKKKKRILMHRLILSTPKGYITDHINRNSLDNRKANLRIVTAQENAMNHAGKKHSASKYKGVCYLKNKKRWKASIMIQGKAKHLGSFINEEDAAKAYNEAAKKYFGEFAYLNVIEKNGG